MGAASGMAQVNVCVDRQVKNRAEEALRISGGTLPELIKKVVAKVAQGGGSCEEVLSAVDDQPPSAGGTSPFVASWRRWISFTRTWASIHRLRLMTAAGTQSIPKPWMSIIAKRG